MKRWLARAAVAFAGLLALLLVYGVAIEPRFILDVRRYEAQLPQLGEQWSGTEVAVVSDLQIGMWWANEGMVERAVEEIVEASPDVALLGGDFVYSTSPGVDVQVDRVLELLSPLLQAGIPTYAVLGNHDHAVGAADALTEALEDQGIPVLLNEAVEVPAPQGVDEPLYVVGLGPKLPGRTDVDDALSGVPEDAARVVLMHNPTVFDRLPPSSAPLALAGHTHCGQVALPGTPRWSYLALSDEEALVADGFAPPDYGAQDNQMLVTCGIGFSTLPVRINAPPQVAFFELVRP